MSHKTMSHFDFAIFQDGRQVLKKVAKAEMLFHQISDSGQQMGCFANLEDI
jgi:hypothetical protein